MRNLLTPINRTAALVTGRVSEEETELEALIRQVQDLQKAISSAKTTRALPLSHVQELGRQRFAIQIRIREIKQRKHQRFRDHIGYHFMEICREQMSKPEFDRWRGLAVKRREEAEATPEEPKVP